MTLVRASYENGFTLVEVLVTIITISILAAITLPSFLNQVNKARQTEAQVNLGSILRAQQAYVTEKLEFAELSQLELGITDSQNYTYSSYLNEGEVVVEASPVSTLKGYAGRVWISGRILQDDSPKTQTLICEGEVGIVPLVSQLEECQ